MSDPIRTEGEPHDRLTRLCDAMTRTLEAHPEYQEGDKCVVFLDSDVDRAGGLVMHGYDSDSEALADLFMHLRPIFEVNGRHLLFVPLPGEG